jgi:hypothetical protein
MYICCALVGAIKDSANNNIFVSVKPKKNMQINTHTYSGLQMGKGLRTCHFENSQVTTQTTWRAEV